MEAGRARSSRAAKAAEKGAMGFEDTGDSLRIRNRRPFVELEGPAEQDAVGARKHVPGLAIEGIANLRLRQQDGELAAGGPKALVAEKLARAEAGAVEDQALRQRRDFRTRG